MDWLVRRLLQIPYEAEPAPVAPAARRSRYLPRVLAVVGVFAAAAAPRVWPGDVLKSQLADIWSTIAPEEPGAAAGVVKAAGAAPAGVFAAKSPVRIAAAALRVNGALVHPEPLAEVVTSTGTLLAAEGVELQAEVSGKITSIAFVEGKRVKKGELLVKLNDADLRAMQLGASHELARAQRAERRAKELLEKGFLREDEYDIALSEMHVKEAALALTRAQIAKTEIRAPFDGVTGLRYVSEGAFVSASTQIATLQRTDALKLDFAIPERYAQAVQSGSRVTFSVASSSKQFEGEVYAFDPRIDPDTRTLLIRALCPNPGGALLPGAFASVSLTLDITPDALLVPAASVMPDYESAFVFVIAAGRAERRQVTTGVRTDTRVQITSGLRPGEVVATSGLQQIRHGMEVDVEVREATGTPVPTQRGGSGGAQTMASNYR